MHIIQKYNSPYLRLAFTYFLIISMIWMTILFFVYQPYFFNDENYMHAVATKKGAWKAYLDLCQYKPRLVSNACVLFFYRIFSESRIYFALLSIFFQAFSSAIIFTILLKWLRLNLISCIFLGIGLTFIRFNIYCLYEFNLGLIEGIAQSFVALFFLSLCALWLNFTRQNYGMCLLFSIIATLCHERFISCFLPLIAILTVHAYYKWNRRFIELIVITSLALSILFFLPKIFHTYGALSGTGGQPLKIFSPQTRHQFTEVVKNIFGLNKGPNYLVGISQSTSMIQRLLTLPETIVIIIGILVAIYSTYKIKPNDESIHKNPVILKLPNFPNYYFSLILIITIVIPLLWVSSMGIRVEMRWLLAPFQILIIAIIFSLKHFKIRNYFATAIGITALIAFFAQIPGFKNIYFIGESKSSNALGSILSTGIYKGKIIKITQDSDDVAWPEFIFRFIKCGMVKSNQSSISGDVIVLRVVQGRVDLMENFQIITKLKVLFENNANISQIEQSLHIHQLLTNTDLVHSNKSQIIGWNIDPLGFSSGNHGLDVDSKEVWGWQEVPVKSGEALILVMQVQACTSSPSRGVSQLNWGQNGRLSSAWRTIFTPSTNISFVYEYINVPNDIDEAAVVLSGQDGGKISILKTCLFRIDNL